MVSLPFVFVSPAEADDSLLFARKPDNGKDSQYLSNIRKSLSPFLAVTNAFKFEAITIGQNKPSINEVEMMLFEVTQPFRFVPSHNYCIYHNYLNVKK